jgi:nitroreductase
MFIDLLRKRRSIRQFKDSVVEQEKVDTLIEAVLRSPSSRGLNPWEFLVVNDPETIEKMSRAKTHGSAFLKNAPLAIVVCADPEKSDVWIEDSAIASLILHLAATDLGLGSCWVQIRRREHDKELSAEKYICNTLELREGLVIEAIVAIGYAAEEKTGHDFSTLRHERVSHKYYSVE